MSTGQFVAGTSDGEAPRQNVALPQLVIEHRLRHGLCYTCGSQICRVDLGTHQLSPLSIPGVSNRGRCLFCYPLPNGDKNGNLQSEEEVDEVKVLGVKRSGSEEVSQVPVQAVAAKISPPASQNRQQQEEEEVLEVDDSDSDDASSYTAKENCKPQARTNLANKEDNKQNDAFQENFISKPEDDDDDDDLSAATVAFLPQSEPEDNDGDDSSAATVTTPQATAPKTMPRSFLKRAPPSSHAARVQKKRAPPSPTTTPDETYETIIDNPSNATTIMDADSLLFVGTVLEGNKTKGRGRFIHVFGDDSDKTGKAIVYVGEFQDGRMHGKGVARDNGAGCVYDGEFVNGAAHGHGTCRWDQGWKYVGQWAQDKRHGFGTCSQLEEGGEIYEGEWKNDMWEGKGTLRFTSGGFCTGTFRSNKLHGWGKYRFADGSIYEGFFHNDLREGRGSMEYADGVRYMGEWQKNWRHGKGSLTWRDGTKFEGRFQADARHGEGYFHMPDGIVRKERYINGVLQK